MQSSTGARLLMVEDVLPLSILYRKWVMSMGVEVVAAATVAQARAEMARGPWHVALLDVHLPDGTGLDVAQDLRVAWPACQLIVISADDASSVWGGQENGLTDGFIQKPMDPTKLRSAVSAALQLFDGVACPGPVHRGRRTGFCQFIGDSVPMVAVYQTIESIASSRAPVFISGESGTGKELAADAIHSCSPRAQGPFVAINCASIPVDLIESELFGHVKGAFTGAHADRDGAFIQAHNGTLFLDEIAELDVQVQAKLLRTLQSEEVRRVGETRVRKVDVRVVSATHRDLRADIAQGRFREDLFYRLHVIPVRMPPLRERSTDVLLIAQAVLERFAREDGRRFDRFSPECIDFMLRYDWPGNVRELINAVRAVVAMFDSEVVEYEMLSSCLRVGLEHKTRALHGQEGGAMSDPSRFDASDFHHLFYQHIVPMADVERLVIEGALQQCGGNITRAAKALQLNPSTIHRKLANWSAASDVFSPLTLKKGQS